MRNIGRLEKYPELEAIADAIFSKKASTKLPDGTTLKTRRFKDTLYAVDHQGLRYVEQNPNTSSAYAQKARQGSRILWVIRTHRKALDANTGQPHWVRCQSDEWLGRVEDGIVFMK